jgi:hypothetical protein
MKYLLALLFFSSATITSHAAGELDLSFVPKLYSNGDVQLVVKTPGGKTIVAGQFDWINGQPADWLACLNADGSVDTSFNPKRPDMIERVTLVVPQADGIILLGYSYALKMYAMAGMTNTTPPSTTVSDTPITLINGFVAKLRRLNADGSIDHSVLDASFSSVSSEGARSSGGGRRWQRTSCRTWSCSAMGPSSSQAPSGQ